MYFLLFQYKSNKWLVRVKKKKKPCFNICRAAQAFCEASGCFADETVTFKLLPACKPYNKNNPTSF